LLAIPRTTSSAPIRAPSTAWLARSWAGSARRTIPEGRTGPRRKHRSRRPRSATRTEAGALGLRRIRLAADQGAGNHLSRAVRAIWPSRWASGVSLQNGRLLPMRGVVRIASDVAAVALWIALGRPGRVADSPFGSRGEAFSGHPPASMFCLLAARSETASPKVRGGYGITYSGRPRGLDLFGRFPNLDIEMREMRPRCD
jgi:hypothetical protein